MENFKRYFLFFISVLLAIFVIVYFLLAFYVAKQAERDTKSRADAILVLGARSYINGNYNPCLQARVVHAVELYKRGYASKIVVSGGNDSEDSSNEADTMKKMAVEKGVPSTAILEERAATSTYENFGFSYNILKEKNLNSIVVVTEPFHIARADLVAKKLGISYTVSPASESPCWQPIHYFTKYFLKEPLAIMGYKVENKL